MQAVFINHWKANTNVNAILPGYDLFIKMCLRTQAFYVYFHLTSNSKKRAQLKVVKR